MALLEDLRHKPDDTKRKIAFVSAAVVVGVLGFVWFTTLPARFEETAQTTASVTQATQKDSNPTGGTFSHIKESFNTLIKSFQSTPAAAPATERAPSAEEDMSTKPATEASPAGVPEDATAKRTGTEETGDKQVILIGTSTNSNEQKSE